jgi:uncharacterized membrane protein
MSEYDLYRLFKTLHVISVVVLGSGFVIEAICGILAAKARTVQEVRVLARLMAFSEDVLSPIAAVALAVFGYLTASQLDLSLDVTWVLLGQILFFGIVVLAIAVLKPAADELYRLSQAAPDGPVPPGVQARLKKPLPSIVGPVTSVAFVFIIYLMVAKPSW